MKKINTITESDTTYCISSIVLTVAGSCTDYSFNLLMQRDMRDYGESTDNQGEGTKKV